MPGPLDGFGSGSAISNFHCLPSILPGVTLTSFVIYPAFSFFADARHLCLMRLIQASGIPVHARIYLLSITACSVQLPCPLCHLGLPVDHCLCDYYVFAHGCRSAACPNGMSAVPVIHPRPWPGGVCLSYSQPRRMRVDVVRPHVRSGNCK